MRVLVTNKQNIDAYEVMEIVNIGFDNDITFEKEFSNAKPLSGLRFVDRDNDYHYILNLTKDICDEICELIIVNGYIDLTHYGPYISDGDSY